MQLSKIIDTIENFAPLNLACEWDNSGWQINLGNQETNKILLCLSPTENVVEQAIEQRCDLIIAHHPLMFKKINKIDYYKSTNKPILKAIQNNIQIYSAHTNLDSAVGGIADVLADMIGLENSKPFEKIDENTGLGRVGMLNNEVEINEFLNLLKEKLGLKNIKLINNTNKKMLKTVALCPGSGGDFINKLKDIDIFITADIKYHDAIETDTFIIADCGHFETERIILPKLKELLSQFDSEILIAHESEPWQIF